MSYKPKNENSRCVFVGNIPYDSNEQELVNIFSRIGQVVSFRMVTDRDTGKPKGYGFIEFPDKHTAMNAIRQLNNMEFYGRSLRVDHATADSNSASDLNLDSDKIRSSYRKCSVPIEKPTLSKEIVDVVKSFSYDEKLEILANMKALIEQNKSSAEQLIDENPKLGQAILSILILFNLVTAEEVKSYQEDDVRRQKELKRSSEINSTNLANINKSNLANQNLATQNLAKKSKIENNSIPNKIKDKNDKNKISNDLKTDLANSNSENLAKSKKAKIEETNNKSDIMEQLPENQRQMLQKLLKLKDEQIAKMPKEIQQKVYALKQKMLK